ncbi:Tetratricopeptide_repeat protein [Hexamita inflata]|uniref:Tetratricopeptide repeat protein n=1 Tax=Hexamita inflata TaxID=28002 RepID=A0AA86NX15_9EUKA|nr:Tetratricopeptide repeat protein [Hexamita inflata]
MNSVESVPPVLKEEDNQLVELDAPIFIEASRIKDLADTLYKQASYKAAISMYESGIELLHDLPKSLLLSQLFFNISLCCKNISDFDGQKQALLSCLSVNSRYRRARVSLANLFTQLNNHISAQLEWQSASDIQPLSISEQQLKNEADKRAVTETLGTLKNWGNKILNKFGMDLNQFKVNKNDDGTMNIQMEKKE